MNILYLSHRVPFPANKGEKIRTFNQIRVLTQAGHSVDLLAPLFEHAELEYFSELSKRYCTIAEYAELPPRWQRMARGLINHEPLSVANFYGPELQAKFEALIQIKKYDAIICTASSMAEYLLHKDLNAKLKQALPMLIMDFMDVDSDKWAQYAQRARWPMRWVYQREHKLLSAYEKSVLEQFEHAFLISEAEVAVMREKHQQPFEHLLAIGNGMDTDFFSYDAEYPKHAELTLLFTGVMDYLPNVDAVCWFVESCWQQIRQRWPNARFVIAGMNPNAKVRALAEQAGVEVTGFVDDIRPYYQEAHVFVAPFRIARGVQNKVLQALACGLPVIATPIAAEGIDIVDGEHALIAEQPEQFIDYLAQLLDSEQQVEKQREAGLSLIKQHYSWEGVMRDFLALLAEPPAQEGAA